jgi:hypothetical protein
MNGQSASLYIILQVLNVSIYVPLFSVDTAERQSGDRLMLENVRVRSKGVFKHDGPLLKYDAQKNEHYLERLRIVASAQEDPHEKTGEANKPDETATFVTSPANFKILKIMVEENRSKDLRIDADLSSNVRIKGLELEIPLIIQLFLHLPIILMAIITLYLFLSLKIEEGGLTERDIEELPFCVYSERVSGSRGCTICLEDFEPGCCVRPLKCGHLFHKDCVDVWLFRSSMCPVCRSSVFAKSEQLGENLHIL